MTQMQPQGSGFADSDPVETQEWIEALAAVAAHSGGERAQFLLRQLEDVARRHGVFLTGQPYSSYRNTIPVAQQGSYPGHLLVGLRVPKGTKVPTSFSTRRIIGGEGQLILSRNRTYTQELNRKAPRRKNERWLGFSSRPVATDEHDAGQTAVFRVVVRAPKRLLGKQFKVRPVVGWHSPVGDDDRVNVNCHKNVYMKLVGAGVDPYSQCISAPHQSSMDPVVVKLKKPKKKKKR